MRTLISIVLAFTMLPALAVQNPPSLNSDAASTALHDGVLAFKNARYQEAVIAFRRAVDLKPDWLQARMYLGTALAQQYIPGADTPDNKALVATAIDQFQFVLDRDPHNVSAAKAIASLYLNSRKLDQARKAYEQIVEMDPKDPEMYYAIAVIDWSESYQRRMDIRGKLKLEPTQSLAGLAECWPLRDANRDAVEDGIAKLTKSLELRPDYDDAMAYMNLMYRERADLDCGDLQANVADLQKADKWVDLTMATKKRKVETQTLPTPQKDRSAPE